MNDLRYAFRQALKRPGFSIVIVLMLALGIGSTTAVFSIFHTFLLAPLPATEPDRLFNLESAGPKWGMTNTNMAGNSESVFSYPMFRDLEARQDVFTGIAGHTMFDVNLASGDRTMSGYGTLVSGEYFTVLGMQPALGRLIGSADEPGVDESPVVVLSHAYWRSQFGSDPNVLGETLTVNGEPLTIVGVTAEGFSGTTLGVRPQVFVPLSMRWRVQPTASRDADDRRSYWLYLFARLRDGVTVEQAEAAISTLHSGILNEVEVPLNANMPDAVLEQFRNRRIELTPGTRGQSWLREAPGDTVLMLLLGLAVLVLLIACVNIANLLLARGTTRAGELAVRASIGATRRQLVRQLLTETAMLALVGGAASLPVAVATLSGIVALLPSEQAVAFALEISPAAVTFAIAATFVTLFLFGVLPALRASQTDPGLIVKGRSRGAEGARAGLRLPAILATGQIALSTVLLVLAGLFVQSLLNLGRVGLGMAVDSVATFSVSPSRSGYSPEQTIAYFDRLEQALAVEPGVIGVSSASVPLLSNASSMRGLSVEGFASGPSVDSVAAMNEVSPGFFETLSIPLLSGRDFTPADRLDAPRVAVVNQSFVEKFDLGENPVGKRFAIGTTASELDIEIVGTVGDSKYNTVKNEAPPQFFLSRFQNRNLGGLQFYLRSALGPEGALETIAGTVTRVDPNIPISRLQTVERTVEENAYIDRTIAILSAAFAALATLLAATGLYGTLAYNFAHRTRELGLRLALGATPGGLLKLVMRQVGRMALIGGLSGLAAAVAVGRLSESLLFGVLGYDPAVIVSTIAVLGVVMLGASLLPAWRAARTAPMQALRYE